MSAKMATKTTEKPRTKTVTKTQRPPLWKVILLNDDYTPREFVVQVLKAVFRLNESQAYRDARDALLKDEKELIAKTKAVAAKRRELPLEIESGHAQVETSPASDGVGLQQGHKVILFGDRDQQGRRLLRADRHPELVALRQLPQPHLRPGTVRASGLGDRKSVV